MREPVTLRTTWRYRAFQGATYGVVAAIVFGLVGAIVRHPLVIGAVGALATVTLVEVRLARRSLTLSDGGILLRRENYEISSPWSSVGPIASGRYARLLPVTTLPLDPPATISPIDRDVSDRLQRRIRGSGADRTVLLSAYTSDWRTGAFGEAVRRYRPDLLDAESTTT